MPNALIYQTGFITCHINPSNKGQSLNIRGIVHNHAVKALAWLFVLVRDPEEGRGGNQWLRFILQKVLASITTQKIKCIIEMTPTVLEAALSFFFKDAISSVSRTSMSAMNNNFQVCDQPLLFISLWVCSRAAVTASSRLSAPSRDWRLRSASEWSPVHSDNKNYYINIVIIMDETELI